jgi:transposase
MTLAAHFLQSILAVQEEILIMYEEMRNQIALFRYGIIAPLVTKGITAPSERGQFFRDAGSRTYEFIDGRTVTVSADTVYRYYRAYQNGGFEALKPAGRSDVGKIRKLDGDILAQIEYLHREYPRLPSTMIYQKLLDNQTIRKDDVSLSTITRYVSTLKKESGDYGKEYRRYELSHINEVWYGDSSVGPYLRIGKKKHKTWIIALIDDASRYIVGIDIFFNDNYVNLLSVIRSAVIRNGKPKTMKFDNGASYRSCQMELLGARMGTAICYAPPRTPTGKAKIERWFRTMKDHWMANLKMDDYHSLEELQESLMAYVQKYNQSPHTSLNQKTPQDRFYEESQLIIRLDEQTVERTFLLEIDRKVSADNVINIDGELYEVDYRYSNQSLLIRYSPDLSKIYSVDRKSGELTEIHLLNKKKNADCHRHSAFMFSGEVGN